MTYNYAGGKCGRCGTEYSGPVCPVCAYRRMNRWTVVLIIIILAVLFALPAHAETSTECHGNSSCQGYQLAYMPIAPTPIDHFSPAQIYAAMAAEGYEPAAWGVYTHCVLDYDNTNYRWCYTSLDAGNGPGTQQIVNWLPWQFAPNGVLARKGIR